MTVSVRWSMRLLVVQHQASPGELLRYRLMPQHAVETACDEFTTEKFAVSCNFDAALIARSINEDSRFGIIRSIRSIRPDLPILIVTADCSFGERVSALYAGADDWIAEPFSQAELEARIQTVVLRATNKTAKTVLTVEDLSLDCLSRTAQRGSRLIDLPPKEFELLRLLMERAGRPVSATEIVNRVWDCDHDTNVHVVYVFYLRQKIDRGFERKLIRTVRGIGYQIGGRNFCRA
jgi:two-component system, OmpR family, response regulator